MNGVMGSHETPKCSSLVSLSVYAGKCEGSQQKSLWTLWSGIPRSVHILVVHGSVSGWSGHMLLSVMAKGASLLQVKVNNSQQLFQSLIKVLLQSSVAMILS